MKYDAAFHSITRLLTRHAHEAGSAEEARKILYTTIADASYDRIVTIMEELKK